MPSRVSQSKWTDHEFERIPRMNATGHSWIVPTTLTRRGWGVVVIVGFCLLMAWGYGARSLNAIVVPLVVVLIAGILSVVRTETPTVTREPLADGYIGDSRTVSLAFAVDRPIAAVVADTVGDGVRAIGAVSETTLLGVDDSEYDYEIHLEERGVHPIGPLTVSIRDTLGVAKRRVRIETTQTVLVYPAVYELHDGSTTQLQQQTNPTPEDDREEFDHLRTYERGDSRRDIHWKATAKRADDELVVKAFTTNQTARSVEIAAEATPGAADEMATAVASIALSLLDLGTAVSVTTPTGRCNQATGQNQQIAILRLLARTDAGELPPQARQAADITIRAEETGATVTIADDVISFDRLSRGVVTRPVPSDELGDADNGAPVEVSG